MNTLHVTRELMASGDSDFYFYVRDVLTGAIGKRVNGRLVRWEGDIKALPGATLACVEFGIRKKADVAAAVSRIANCKPGTVVRFIELFTGADPERRIFFEQNGELICHPGALRDEYPDFAIAG